MKTATKPDSGATAISETNQNQAGKKPEELRATYDTLKSYLNQLELENQRLAADLDKKRKQRAERESKRTPDRSREHLAKMEAHLRKTGEVAERQKAHLDRMRAYYQQNEAKLKSIAQRLRAMETAMNKEDVPVETMKSELQKMLRELGEMRKKREKLTGNA